MRITELVVDGFKSYSHRTVIAPWDPTFNSITGLNGSGKSNILDAICFCLGITTYTTLRASGGVQDLIYKRGQAGVTKASVTIVFDNSDRAKSPVGFENVNIISVTRTVVLGGTSKYLINGHRAQQTTVQNLFQSVQLNINNPNFLIMQGRITKVLNMKSTEILGMVEEAAGTRMFEDRKEKARKNMAKKDAKVQELDELLKEEIEPKLDKLRNEKRAFLEFQTVQSDLERLTKVVVAYDYIRSKQKLQQSQVDLEAKRARAGELEDNAERLRREVGVLEEDLAKVQAARDKELRKGGKFARLEEAVKTHSHEMTRLETVLSLKKETLSEEQDKLIKAENCLEDLQKQVEEKTTAYDKLRVKYEKANKAVEDSKTNVDKKEDLLHTLQTGVSSSSDGKHGGYQGQLAAAREISCKASTEIEQSKLKIQHLEVRIKEDEPRAKKAEIENASLLKDLDVLRKQALKLEKELGRLGFDPAQETKQQSERQHLEKRIRELQADAELLRRKAAGLDFTYQDPTPDFDRGRVKGLVARLFALPEEKLSAATALEIAAGGRLYNVVVDTAETGTQLLQKGKLRRRVTIVPLDKVTAQRAAQDRVQAAQDKCPNKVSLALTVIGYDQEVEKAMEFVFGNTLVCADAATAKTVTFDPNVRLKSVTLEGDVYDPNGTLSGGSAAQGSGVLLMLQKLRKIETEIELEQYKLDQLEKIMAEEAKRFESAKQIKVELDLKSHEVHLAEQQIASNSSSSIIAQVVEHKNTIVALKEKVEEAKTTQKAAEMEVKKIEKDMKDFSSDKGAKLQQLQREVSNLKRDLIQSQSSIKPLQQEVRESLVDLEQTGADLSAAEEDLADAKVTVKSQEVELEKVEGEQKQSKDAYDEAQAALQDERAKLSGFDEELAELEKTIKGKNQRLVDEKLEGQKIGHQLENFGKAQQSAQQSLAAMEKEHDFILEERSSFGKPGTPYDFAGQDMSYSKKRLVDVRERFGTMKKKVNPSVMASIDGVEKKEASLKQMMKTVVKDKKKIEDTILTLDDYKREALHKTWQEVNGHFGSIFNDLLPGNTAKLEPLEGKGVSEGLEVKVCLGKVWKQSLTELSGGQRSLIALSLILSLLQYSPAPMYILDEVDAALDLSHTENIGRLIRTRFKGSQFIVVSLKDGMFSNANRIFKTKFMDGTSVVQALGPQDMK